MRHVISPPAFLKSDPVQDKHASLLQHEIYREKSSPSLFDQPFHNQKSNTVEPPTTPLLHTDFGAGIVSAFVGPVSFLHCLPQHGRNAS